MGYTSSSHVVQYELEDPVYVADCCGRFGCW